MSALAELRSVFDTAIAKEVPLTLTVEQAKLVYDAAPLLRTTVAHSGVMISVEEVCAELRMTRQTLWRLRRAGNFIPAVNPHGRRLLFRRDDFNAWLASQPRA